jgi:SAM-dependent methyltransferase
MATMTQSRVLKESGMWKCLRCGGALTRGETRLTCPAHHEYPVVAGVPLLVREPLHYFSTQRAALLRIIDDIRLRRDALDIDPYAGLAEATRERHRDVLSVEAAQTEIFLALLDPGAPLFEAPPAEAQVVRSGWAFDTMVPYMLRDWTGTPEFHAMSARICAALERALPDSRNKTIAFAGCGAGGLLAKVPTDFGRIVGFDLTLPILAAARKILDGKVLDLPLPRILSECGRISLAGGEARNVEVVAMDTLETAFPDRSVDCIITVFLTDIVADAIELASEIRRILSDDGVWINYGPAGNNLKALWRFDQAEAAAFFNKAGFTVAQAEAYRSSNLDISNVLPAVSFRNVMCYLTVVRKTGELATRAMSKKLQPDDIAESIPLHFPGANLAHQLDRTEKNSMLLQHERIAGRAESWQIGRRAARVLVQVDGKKTVGQIAELLKPRSSSVDETLRAFARFYEQGLLTWRHRS